MLRLLCSILLALALAACGSAPRTPQGLPAAVPTAAAAAATAGPVLARLPAGERTADLVAAVVGAPFELELGEQISVGDSGIGLTFVAVDEDSRCPVGLSCIWQGRAVVSLELTMGDGEAQAFSLAIPGDLTPDAPELRTFGAYSLRMLDLAPYPAGPGGSPEPYVITLVLEQ